MEVNGTKKLDQAFATRYLQEGSFHKSFHFLRIFRTNNEKTKEKVKIRKVKFKSNENNDP